MHIVDVIKYEGDNHTFISKHPAEDFNTSTQLIVHESQRAIFFYNGQALDTFGPGRHTLETQNIPLLTSLTSRVVTDGDSPFHAEVYFVNLVEQMGIPWGTNSKIQYLDPEFNFPLSIGASGEMAIAVEDPRRLLVKLVGTEAILSQAKLIGYFRSFLQTRIKTVISGAISEQKLNIFQMDAHLEDLSAAIKHSLSPDFESYGLRLSQFMVTNIVKPEGETVYEKFKDLYFRQFADVQEARIQQQTAVIDAETLAQKKVIDARAQAEKRRAEGYTYQQERSFDVAEKVAANEAVGEFSNLGVGMGVLTGVSGPVGSMVGTAMSDAVDPAVYTAAVAQQPAPSPNELSNEAASGRPSRFCPECGYQFPSPAMKFCPECGAKRR